MVSAHVNALGVIFPNSYDSLVPELVTDRSMASIPFASRYRMIDFPLSSMVNAGIDNVSIVVRKNYHSLMDHLGNGREWDLTRKNGGLNIVPPFASKAAKMYHGRIEALYSILSFLQSQKEEYVIMSDANVASTIDFKDLIQYHIDTGADVTIAYADRPLSEDTLTNDDPNRDMYYTLELDGQRITDLRIMPRDLGVQHLSMNIYVVSRKLLIAQIEDAYAKGYVYYERDVLLPHIRDWNVQGYEFTGYIALIHSMRSYFEENMRLLDEANAEALFAEPVYTKIRDDTPTRYTNGSVASNAMVADGCVIEGTIENCILFRGVKVEKGAVVRNCILMQGTVVGQNAQMEYIITDKNVTISARQFLKGSASFPVYINKGKVV